MSGIWHIVEKTASFPKINRELNGFSEGGNMLYDDANILYLPPIRGMRRCAEKAGEGRSVFSTYSATSFSRLQSALIINLHYLHQMKFIKTVAFLTSVSASAAFAPSRNTNLPHTQTSTSLDMGITLYGSQGSR